MRMTPDQPTNNTIAALGVILPYAFQAFVLLLMTVIVLVHDGISTDTAIQALVIIGGGNALAGGVISTANILAKARVEQTKVTANTPQDVSS